MVADGPVFDPGLNVNTEFSNIASAGVGRVRIPFSWAAAQPYANIKEVPPGQLSQFVPGGPNKPPTTYVFTDEVVTAAAQAGVSLLPVITYAPGWDASTGGNHSEPARDRPYAQYVTALIQRYGPKGTFWTANPTVPKDPITEWEIWNEEDLVGSWNTSPFASSYVGLLRVAYPAVKKADPSATVVLGALTGYGVEGPGIDLRRVREPQAVRRRRGQLLHPDPRGCDPDPGRLPAGDEQERRSSQAPARDRGRLVLRRGQTSHTATFSVTEQGQAKRISQLLPLLARNRRSLGLAGFDYYTWMTTDPPGGNAFDFSGLLHYDVSTNTITAKPAYSAFKRAVKALEGEGRRSDPRVSALA